MGEPAGANHLLNFVRLSERKNRGDVYVLERIGGPGEDRTPDPLVANQIQAIIEIC